MRPKWILFHLLCLTGIVAMLFLSLWQFDRMGERRDFNDEVRDRATMPLLDIAELDSADVDPAALEWRSLGAKGVYLADEQVTIANRSQNGRAGSNVVTPLRLEDGRTILVNRGFLALDDKAPAAPKEKFGWSAPSDRERRVARANPPKRTVTSTSSSVSTSAASTSRSTANC